MLQLRTLEASPVEAMEYHDAVAIWRQYRVDHGWGPDQPFLGQPGSNAKTTKNTLPTYTVSLAPSATSELLNVCPASTAQCRATCLWTTGRGGEPTVVRARKLRTSFVADHPAAAATLVRGELTRAQAKHGRVAARLNALSDIAWETLAPWIFESLPEVVFYDYTKRWTRSAKPAANYHLTFSASERTSDVVIKRKVDQGATVAVVFETKYRPGADHQEPLPDTYAGHRVVDGDKTDERFAEAGVIVGLRAKGKAQQLPVGGFVKSSK